ncbi:hypothetical protein ACFQHN_10830 [Natrialbaceae archaeon GCM10025896]
MRFLRERSIPGRQPEYTGENRCLPCTVGNVGLAGVLAAGVGVVTTVPIGTIVFLGSLVTIYLRGYLVPGTPRLTERYLPHRIRRLFGKDPIAAPTLEDGEAVDPWDVLAAAGVVDRTTGDGVRLDGDFRTHLRRTSSRYAEAPPSVDEIGQVVGTTDVVERGEGAFSVDGTKLLRWESDAALAADVAAASLLEDRLDGWAALDRDVRLDVLRRVRLLAERCPACDGPIDRQHDRVDPCCQPPHVLVWSTCRSCEALLGEVAVPESNVESWAVLEEIGEGASEPSGRAE